MSPAAAVTFAAVLVIACGLAAPAWPRALPARAAGALAAAGFAAQAAWAAAACAGAGRMTVTALIACGFACWSAAAWTAGSGGPCRREQAGWPPR